MNPLTSSKGYWSILKTLLNNNKNSFTSSNKYVVDFKKKAELFHCFFAKQCFIIANSNELSLSIRKKADKSISAITFTCDHIGTLIKNFDPNKSHIYDMINIRLLNFCGKSIYRLKSL